MPSETRQSDPLSVEVLQQRVAELTELAGGLAHELRNPLSTIMINLKLLAEALGDERTPAEEARRRALRKVELLRREAERLQGLFDEFLRLAGPCALQLEEVDLRQILSRLVEFLDPLMHTNRVELTVDLPDSPVRCPVDEKLVSQALLNLALNAQQAMPDGGTLRLTLCEEPEDVVIRVSDTGVGIAEKNVDRIFRPFFSTKSGGTGLGLPLTRRIIEEHGGRLTFTSRRGEGTTFIARLPRKPGRPAAPSGGADRLP